MLHQGYGLFEFVSISSVINKARGQYQRSFLLSESDDDDLTDFLWAQVKVIRRAITNLHAYLERKAGQATALQRRLEGMDGFNHRQIALLHHALLHAGFRYSVISHQNSHGVSNQTARSDLQKLASRGLLIPGKMASGRSFACPLIWLPVCRADLRISAVGAGGLEPPQPCGLRILSPLRLPVSPCPRQARLGEAAGAHQAR